MINAQGINGSYLEYKGRPLVRQDNDIIYGDLAESYHVYMMIMTERPSPVNGEVDVPDTIMVQLKAKGAAMPKKQALAKGLADALEMADAWLESYNNR